MKYTQIPTDTFQKLQLNAGILTSSFDPSTGTIGNLLGATTGGITFNSNPSFSDFGEDIDNCPNGMMELKHLDSYDPTMSGTFLTCTPALAKSLVGAADIDVSLDFKIVPRKDLLIADFEDVWWIGDYSDANTGSSAGFLAIHLLNALNQAGFQITTGKNEKGQLAFEYHGHYSMDAQDKVPFEIYCKAGTSSTDPYIQLSEHLLKLTTTSDDVTLAATVNPAGTTVTWNSSATGKAEVTNGVVHPVAAGSAIITASITVNSVTYTDTCTVIVT